MSTKPSQVERRQDARAKSESKTDGRKRRSSCVTRFQKSAVEGDQDKKIRVKTSSGFRTFVVGARGFLASSDNGSCCLRVVVVVVMRKVPPKSAMLGEEQHQPLQEEHSVPAHLHQLCGELQIEKIMPEDAEPILQDAEPILHSYDMGT
jgi:hypothetical protein